ncbi:MAG: ABC transporter ATP-binding protein/permease [Coriobacteriia bacterium]|nr:ABC transporter ATP-binding protein/permease [Coriobacteriia bacterium]MCL2870807.1 ABC transporter ATP-binding protein/permease [Coriobacteriia bacterium]
MRRLFLRYLKPYPFALVMIVVTTLAQVGFQLYLPTLMSSIVDTGIVRKGMSEQDAAAGIIGTYATQMDYLIQVGGLMLGVTVLSGIAAVLAGYYCSRASAGLARDLREKVFAKVENFSLVEINRFSTASLIIRSTNDIQQIQQVSFMLLRMGLTVPAYIVVAFALAFRENMQLSWIFAAVLPVFFGIFLVTMKYVMPIFRSIQKKTDHLNLIAREGLTGVRVIRAFNRQAFQQARYALANDDLTDANIRAYKIMITLMPLVMLVIQMTTIVIIWFGGHLLADGGVQLGSLMAFQQYVMWVLYSLMFLSMLMVMVPRASVCAERVMEVLDTEPVIKDPVEGTELDVEQAATAAALCSDAADSSVTPVPVVVGSDSAGSLEFDDVSFLFEDQKGVAGEVPTLCNISFRARRGQTFAIIGSTGSGKSTIANLAMRLYDVSSGRILLDGTDIRQMPQQDLRDRMGYIPQKAVLFTGTLAENIRYGKSDASDEEVIEALKIAQAWDFVEQLPEGLDTEVAQGGTNFSGGQRQRLAIARALVKKPEVYLFDDSFSALDLRTDAQLRTALKPLQENSTMVIVAQRIMTIQDADQIMVLEDGRVGGIGTHDELMASNKVYQEIAASQLTAEEVAHYGKQCK